MLEEGCVAWRGVGKVLSEKGSDVLPKIDVSPQNLPEHLIEATFSCENHTNIVLLIFIPFLKNELNRDEENFHALRICDYGKLPDQKFK